MRWLNRSVATLNATLQLFVIYRYRFEGIKLKVLQKIYLDQLYLLMLFYFPERNKFEK